MGIEEFLRQREILKELRRVAGKGRKSLIVKFDQLLEHNLELARGLVCNPTEFLVKADKVLEGITKLPGMRLRVRGLDKSMGAWGLRAGHIGKFVQMEGNVTQAGELKLICTGDGEYKDYQRIRIDEFDVDLTEELVGEVSVGDKVVVTGVLQAIKVDSPIGPDNQFKKLLVANSVVLPDKERAEEKSVEMP